MVGHEVQVLGRQLPLARRHVPRLVGVAAVRRRPNKRTARDHTIDDQTERLREIAETSHLVRRQSKIANSFAITLGSSMATVVPGSALAAGLGHQVARLLLRLVQVVAHGSVGEGERLVDAQLLPEEQEVARLLRRRQTLQLFQLPLMLEN